MRISEVIFSPSITTHECLFALTVCSSDTMWSVLAAIFFLRCGVILVCHLPAASAQLRGVVAVASNTLGTSFAFSICTVPEAQEGQEGRARHVWGKLFNKSNI